MSVVPRTLGLLALATALAAGPVFAQDGRQLHDSIEIRRQRAQTLGRIVRIPMPLGLVG